ncbi:helix-turn-helix domain-containing protein [Kushneria aurantia]|uniref:Helix-turn-helix domain-containing protein n=1 Tax=Kushneria aurantia TaxID=504092 RepID=A0ABV6G4S7_9GAMM|nr:XRE family transcriptional regulator [Kushneria aurantia]
MTPEALQQLGQRIGQLRRQRHWSLSHLAERAGLAKSSLSRLEQGNANPTLDTLWRLAIQLEVPFAELIIDDPAPLDEGGVTARLIERGRGTPVVEAWWMQCRPHACRRAEAHGAGIREHASVISGRLLVGSEGEERQLGPGEHCDFAADRRHLYRGDDEGATFLLTIVYPQRPL